MYKLSKIISKIRFNNKMTLMEEILKFLKKLNKIFKILKILNKIKINKTKIISKS
jgi:hypothetical protein